MKNKRPPLVLGGGRTGIALHNLLQWNGVEHQWITDTRLIDDVEGFARRFDTVFVSPGIARDNAFLSFCISRGAAVISELSYAAGLCRLPIVAVTGTNGKTTVTNMIHSIHRATGADSYCVGNCGVPLSTVIGQASSRARIVCEVSSFMLEWVGSFRPHVAVVTNLSPDHLDRHGGWQAYVDAKRSICTNMTKEDVLVLNRDDDEVMRAFNTDRIKVVTYSLTRVADCCLRGNTLYLDGMRLMDVDELKVRGDHNIANAMAASLAAYHNGISPQTIASALSSFCGVSHRMEYIGRDGRGVAFYNDSKSTNVASTLVALKAFEEQTVLIAGGSPKGYEFDELIAALDPRRVSLIATGGTMGRIARAAERQGYGNLICEPQFDRAVKAAGSKACSGASVLLSPACASFDQFRDYRERGETFRRIVREEFLRENAISQQ